MFDKNMIEKANNLLDRYYVRYVKDNKEERIVFKIRGSPKIFRSFKITNDGFYDEKLEKIITETEWTCAINIQLNSAGLQGSWKKSLYRKYNPKSTCQGRIVIRGKNYKNLIGSKRYKLGYYQQCRKFIGYKDNGHKKWFNIRKHLFLFGYSKNGETSEFLKSGKIKGKGKDHTARNQDIATLILQYDVDIEFIMAHTGLSRNMIYKIVRPYREEDPLKNWLKEKNLCVYDRRNK